jgi:formylglycine-generating enzyme required for sulfatase activity
MKKTALLILLLPVLWIPAACASTSQAQREPHPQEITNSIGMELRLIQAGSFTMGYDGQGAWDHEQPTHKVTITKDYYIGVYEVTQAQYVAIQGENPSRFRGDDRPVDSVTWRQAVEFCKKLSKKEGVTYRLPTEAEWEYACRAGTTTKYYWGNIDELAGTFAWYGENSDNQTHPVGQKKANAWGLYDMSGNVEEWAHDRFRAFTRRAQTDPKGPAIGRNSRPLRGGSFFYTPEYLRSSVRHPNSTTDRDPRIGFRVVMETE